MLAYHLCGICIVALMAATAMAAAGEATKPTIRGAAVRYQVADIDRSIAFYTERLGFRLDQRAGPAFARVSNGSLVLYLSGPQSSGSRPLADGRRQEPGGWNRIVLEVSDLPALVTQLQRADVRFRNEIVTGPGGRQVQIEDPDGNPVELFQPAPSSPPTSSATRPADDRPQ